MKFNGGDIFILKSTSGEKKKKKAKCIFSEVIYTLKKPSDIGRKKSEMCEGPCWESICLTF